MFLANLIQKPLALRRHVPGIRPEAEIDTPPVVGDPRAQELGHQLIKVEPAGAEWIMRAGVVLVERSVGVDQMDMGDLALELL